MLPELYIFPSFVAYETKYGMPNDCFASNHCTAGLANIRGSDTRFRFLGNRQTQSALALSMFATDGLAVLIYLLTKYWGIKGTAVATVLTTLAIKPFGS